jgi:hypothetical protein
MYMLRELMIGAAAEAAAAQDSNLEPRD